MIHKIAVIQFPGSNCEYETISALEAAGASVDLIRWNVNETTFHSYSGYALPGGFSYQDRIRSGVISSKLPVIAYLKEVARQEKPILGICNGCQILAESGLVPDLGEGQQIEMALAPNMKGDEPLGFVCDWVYVKPQFSSSSLFFSEFKDNDVLPIPINHGEGRFLFSGDAVLSSHTARFLYCDHEGNPAESYPVNPNGAMHHIAGLTNKRGNVLAMMPHPERSTFLKQIPRSIQHQWGDDKVRNLQSLDQEGPWMPLFRSFVAAVGKNI